MVDIHGNIVEVRDNIYINQPAIAGSKSKRLLYGVVVATGSGTCRVKVFENGRVYSVTSATCLKPME